jgi:type IV conjugative transfer system coupling protein TraD
MMKKKQGHFHTDAFTRGGQIFSHEWRMRLQNFRTVALIGLCCGSMGIAVSAWYSGITWWLLCDFYTLSYLSGKIKLSLWHSLQPKLIELDVFLRGLMRGSKGIPSAYKSLSQLTSDLMVPGEGRISMRTIKFLQHPWVVVQASRVNTVLLWGLTSFSAGMLAMIVGFSRKSKKIEEDKILSGKKLVSPEEVRSSVQKRKLVSVFKIAPGLPMVKNSETCHTLIVGKTGTGKTTCIYHLLNQIQDKKQRAVILDTNGAYVNRYYDPDRGDLILNPFDCRSVRWDLWRDCRKTSHYDQFAAALIPAPKSHESPVWHQNAREIISTTAEKLALENNRSLQKLVETACWKAVKEVKGFFRDTPVESLMNASGRAEEVVHSVRISMTAAMKRLAMLPGEGQSFSLSDWVRKEESPGWLFISCDADDRETLGSLMKFWTTLAMNALFKRGEDLNHRLWFIMDELFSLEGGTVSRLQRFLNESRKYGGCGVLGLQNLADVEEVYGMTGLRSIYSNCNTKVIMKTDDPRTASYISEAMGEQEVIETNENLSMGSHHMRDGVNMGTQRRIKPVVSKTEIMDLATLKAYVLLPEGMPLTQVEYPILNIPITSRQDDFIQEVSLLSLLKNAHIDGSALIQEIEGIVLPGRKRTPEPREISSSIQDDG